MKKFFVIYSLKQKLSPTLYKTKKTVTKHTTVNKSLKFEEFETEEQAKTFIEQISLETKVKDTPFLSEIQINNILRSIVKETKIEMSVLKNREKATLKSKFQKESILRINVNQSTSSWMILPNGHAMRQQKQEQKYDSSYSALRSQQTRYTSSTSKPQLQPQSTTVTQQHTSQAHSQESNFSSSSSSSNPLASRDKLSYWVVWNKNDLSQIEMGMKLVQLGKMLFQLEKENSAEWMKDNIMTRKYRTRKEAADWMGELKRERLLKLNRLKGEMLRVKVSQGQGIRKEDRSDGGVEVQVSSIQKQEEYPMQEQHQQLSDKSQNSKLTSIYQLDQQSQDTPQPSISQSVMPKPQPLIVLNYEDIQPLQITSTKKQAKADNKVTIKQKGIKNERYEKLRWQKELIDETGEGKEEKSQSVGVIVSLESKKQQEGVIVTESGDVKQQEEVTKVVEGQQLLNKVQVSQIKDNHSITSQPQQNQQAVTISQPAKDIPQSQQKSLDLTIQQQTATTNYNIKETEQTIKETQQLLIMNVIENVDTQQVQQDKKTDSIRVQEEVIVEVVLEQKLQEAEQKQIEIQEQKGAPEQNIVNEKPYTIKEHPQVIVQPKITPTYTHPFNKSYIRQLISSRINTHPLYSLTKTQHHPNQQEEYIIYPKLSIKQSPGFSIGSYQIKSSRTKQVVKRQQIILGQTKKQEGNLLALAFSLSAAQHFTNNKRIRIHLDKEMNHALKYEYKLDRQLIQTREFVQQMQSRLNSRVQYVV